jgi:hypothetical protein
MKLPQKYLAPREVKEAIYIMELGFPPEVLDRIPERTLELMMLYKNVRDIAQFGGFFDP